jgi:hypothetical protein
VYSLPGALTGGDLALHRGGGDRGKQESSSYSGSTLPSSSTPCRCSRRTTRLAVVYDLLHVVRYQHVKVRIPIER